MIHLRLNLPIWFTLFNVLLQVSMSSYLKPTQEAHEASDGDKHHSSNSYSAETVPLYIGGFFGSPGTEVYATLPVTVQTAVDHINNLTGILDGYELRVRSGPKVVSYIFTMI